MTLQVRSPAALRHTARMMCSVSVDSGRVSGRVKDPVHKHTVYSTDVMTKYCWVSEEFSRVLEEMAM